MGSRLPSIHILLILILFTFENDKSSTGNTEWKKAKKSNKILSTISFVKKNPRMNGMLLGMSLLLVMLPGENVCADSVPIDLNEDRR